MFNTDWTVLYLRDCELSEIQRRADLRPRFDEMPNAPHRTTLRAAIHRWARAVVGRRANKRPLSPAPAFRSHPVVAACATTR